MTIIWLSDFKKQDVCWDCNNYTTVLIIGINGVCWNCLQRMEKNGEATDDDNEINDELIIGRRMKAYLDYISENNTTTSNYDKMCLAQVMAEDLTSTF